MKSVRPPRSSDTCYQSVAKVLFAQTDQRRLVKPSFISCRGQALKGAARGRRGLHSSTCSLPLCRSHCNTTEPSHRLPALKPRCSKPLICKRVVLQLAPLSPGHLVRLSKALARPFPPSSSCQQFVHTSLIQSRASSEREIAGTRSQHLYLQFFRQHATPCYL